MEFYGLPDAFLPSQPASVEPLVPRLSVYTLGQALQHLDGANFSAAAAKDGKAAKLVRLAPTFVIRSPSSIILDAQAKAYWNGEKGDDEIMRCSEVLLERYATYPDDAEESAFWTALNSALFRGEDIRDLVKAFMNGKQDMAKPYIAFAIGTATSGYGKFAVDVVYMDEETAKGGMYPGMEHILGRDDRFFFENL